MSVTFNGETKRIIVSSDIKEYIVKEIYSDWKEWSRTNDNLKYLQAFRTFGGDPTVEGQTAPAYYFLMNGWRIVVDGFDAIFGYNLYTDEGENPVITLNGGTALLNNSDVGIIKSVVDLVVDYQRYIHVKSTGEAGISHPLGTPSQPVNNLADACTIAKLYGIDNIMIHDADYEYSMANVEHPLNYWAKSKDALINVSEAPFMALERSNFNNCTIYGDFKGAELEANQCHIGNSTSFYGYLKECGLEGTIQAAVDGHVFLIDCYSNIPGTEMPVLDLNINGPTRASIRRFSGGLKVQNLTDPEDVATIEFTVGKCLVDETNTNGLVSIRGVVKVTDLSTGSIVDLSATVSELVDLSSATINTGDIDLTNIETTLNNIDTDIQMINTSISSIDTILTSNSTLLQDIYDINFGRWWIDKVNHQMVMYTPEGAELIRFNLFDENGNPTYNSSTFDKVPV